MNAPRIGARSKIDARQHRLYSLITIRQSLDAIVLQQGDLFRGMVGLGVGERAHFVLVSLIHPLHAVALAGLDQAGPGCLLSLAARTSRCCGAPCTRHRGRSPASETASHVQETSRLGRERETDGEKRIAAVPWRAGGIGRRQAVLSLAAMLVDLDCADTDGRAGRLALPFLRIEFAVDEDDAIADDLPARRSFVAAVLQHVPEFRDRGYHDPSLECAHRSAASKERSEYREGTSSNVRFDTRYRYSFFIDTMRTHFRSRQLQDIERGRIPAIGLAVQPRAPALPLSANN